MKSGKTEKDCLISVIIPVYNMERFLGEAIESVLDQTYAPVEIIVIDDGSTDTCVEIAKEFMPRISYYYQDNQGLGAARNHGISVAKGDCFAFLDADDVWIKNRLEHQILRFGRDNNLEAVFGLVNEFYSPELTEKERGNIRCPQKMAPAHMCTSMLIKREAFFRVGWFKTGLRVGNDMEWYLRAQECGLKNVMVQECVFNRRLHKNNLGIVNQEHSRERVRLLKSALDRRRSKS